VADRQLLTRTGVQPSFPPDAFEALAAIEPSSFWFVARNRLVVWALDRYFADSRSLLEVGCGTGFVLAGVRAARPGMRLVGGDLHASALQIARTRVTDATLLEADALELPYEGEFDVVAAFDVLEHLDADEAALRRMHAAIRPGGGLIVTVPQHPWLWSAADDAAFHRRRYRRSELVAKLRGAGFRPLRVTSFVALPLPAMALLRWRRRGAAGGDYDPLAELAPPRPVNALLRRILDVERAAIRLGVSFPAGGSLLAVARREPA
jgi:SAM-dependent methyltransferase